MARKPKTLDHDGDGRMGGTVVNAAGRMVHLHFVKIAMDQPVGAEVAALTAPPP